MNNLLSVCFKLAQTKGKVEFGTQYTNEDIAVTAKVAGLKNFVVTECYRSKTLWYDRKKAQKYFYSGAMACDGAEADRHMNVCADIEMGKLIATDED